MFDCIFDGYRRPPTDAMRCPIAPLGMHRHGEKKKGQQCHHRVYDGRPCKYEYYLLRTSHLSSGPASTAPWPAGRPPRHLVQVDMDW